MCRKQPGRRCPKHCAETLSRAAAVWQHVKDDPSASDAQRAEARDELLLASTEKDATRDGRRELMDRISELEGRGGAVADRRRRALVTRLVAAESLTDEWRRQDQWMPPPLAADATTREQQLRRAVGKARGQAARVAVQMLLHRNNPDGVNRWADHHQEAVESALHLHAQLRAEQAGGKPDRRHLSVQELRGWRAGGTDADAIVVLSHQRALRAEIPGGFDHHIPQPSHQGGAGRGSSYPVPEPPAHDNSPAPPSAVSSDPAAAADTHTPPPPGPAGTDPTRRADTGGQRARSTPPGADHGTATPAGTDTQTGRRPARSPNKHRMQELSRLRAVVTRAKAMDEKMEQGAVGKPYEIGGLLMLDYFTRALG